jgi:hypothetical protein
MLLIPAVAAVGLAVAPARAADFDVLEAVGGVWAYDPAEVASPGDFTCAERPLAITVVDSGMRVASKRRGDAAERYGLILDVRNDFPLGPALSIVWEDAPHDKNGDPIAAVLVMEDENSFSVIDGPVLEAYLAGSGGLERSPRRSRCGTR